MTCVDEYSRSRTAERGHAQDRSSQRTDPAASWKSAAVRELTAVGQRDTPLPCIDVPNGRAKHQTRRASGRAVSRLASVCHTAPVPPRRGNRNRLFGPHDTSSRPRRMFSRTRSDIRDRHAVPYPSPVHTLRIGAHTFWLYGRMNTCAIPVPNVWTIHSPKFAGIVRFETVADASSRPRRHTSRSASGRRCRLS